MIELKKDHEDENVKVDGLTSGTVRVGGRQIWPDPDPDSGSLSEDEERERADRCR